MPKYDSFGREIGEDTLAGLGGGSKVKPIPKPVEATWQERTDQAEATWQAAEKIEVARLETAADAKDATAERAEDARQAAAGDSRWTAPVKSAAMSARSMAKQPLTITLPVSQGLPTGGRRRGRRVLFFVVLAIIALFVIPLLIAGFAIVGTVGDAKREIDGAIKITRPDSLTRAAPTGVEGRSLVRRARFGPAMRRLQAKGYGRLTNVRVAPERINAQFLTKDGALLAVQLGFDGKLQSFGKSGTGFDSVQTIPYSRVDPGAPERLTRRAAERLGKSPDALDYAVLSQGGPDDLLWGAFFKGGGHVQGFADGRVWRRVS